jgi:valyl-tRNA synthetase
VIEPRLSLQWFVKVAPLARAAGDAVRDGRVAIHPATMRARYFEWVDNMHDWCISRQLWWGHRIPVWYGPGGEVVCVGPHEDRPTGEGWVQDGDVLDTWFSSALWPFSTLGWPEDTADLRRYYPTDVLLTGHDIIFFWVARMMMFGLYAMDGVQPFHTIALTGLVRDQFGRKMSKSKGNVVDPLDWMDAYGADALRFTLARGANPGTDVPIGEEWVAGSRNFCTKLWNAARFALINGATVAGPLPDRSELSVVDRWLLSRLATVTEQVDAGYDDLQFARVSEMLYHFVWDELCDWYLELAKLPLREDGAGGAAAAHVTRRVLGEVLDVVLRLLHPVTPFVTEALWTELTAGRDGAESLVVAAWPAAAMQWVDAGAEAEVGALQGLVTEVRRFRSDQGLPPGKRVPARMTGLAPTLATHEAEIRALAALQPAGDGFQVSSTLTSGPVRVDLDLHGAVDVAAERKRLERDLAAVQKDLTASRAKLANEQFLAKAPEHVVATIRERAERGEADLSRLTASLAALPTG